MPEQLHGTLHLWFAGRANQDSPWAIGYAFSTDGENWNVEPNPVLASSSANSWAQHGVASPNVSLIDGQYVMFYLGFAEDWSSSIGLAVSEDGVNWQVDQASPVLQPSSSSAWMNHALRDPSVIYDGKQWQMWFVGNDDSTSGTSTGIGYALSEDGRNWILPQHHPVLSATSGSSWKSDAVLAPDVLFINGTYHMWFTGEKKSGQLLERRLGHATSPDGVRWQEDALNPIFGLGAADGFASSGAAHPTLAIDRDAYRLWYVGGETWSADQRVGHASSPDGQHWIR